MSDSVKHIEVFGLHGRVNISLTLRPDVNILYGRNGSGKTTVLHIIANILNGSIDRFAYIVFDRIKVCLHSDRVIEVIRIPTEGDSRSYIVEVSVDGNRIIAYDPEMIQGYDATYRPRNRFLLTHGSRFLPTALPRYRREFIEYFSQVSSHSQLLPVERVAYFPAFRTMIEAWRSAQSSISDSSYLPPSDIADPDDDEPILTSLARDLFGRFVPEIDYPSVLEIESELASRTRAAAFDLATASEGILLDAFVNAFAALSGGEHDGAESTDQIRAGIDEVLGELSRIELVEISRSSQNEAYRKLQEILPSVQTSELSGVAARILAVYRDSLQQQVHTQRTTLQPIKRYLESVNEFLEGKRVVIADLTTEQNLFEVLAEFEDGSRENLRALSSGERHVVSMLYASSPLHIAKTGVVLIDEPELSLHIDWQRLLIKRLVEQLEGRQLVVCTHSPEIGADFEDKYQVVKPISSRSDGN